MSEPNAGGASQPADPLPEALRPFFSKNSISRGTLSGDTLVINQPWDDPSIAILVNADNQILIDALNSVFLPPIFCALWHLDTHDLEFIYSSIPIDPDSDDRTFDFIFKTQILKCEYAASSSRLITIAENSKFRSRPTESNYRYLDRFAGGLNYRKRNEDSFPNGNPPPKSFWIRNVEWDEIKLCEIALHVNFYMQYFDRQSPLINILEDKPEASLVAIGRYRHGDFPNTITAQTLNGYLLNLWFQSLTEDPIRRLLHSYQILEYAGHYYINDEMHEKIRKMIAAPDALVRVDEFARKIVDVLAPWNSHDDVRIKQVIKSYVDPVCLWVVIEPHKEYFSNKITFDGGHIQEALISPNTTAESFASPNWVEGFHAKLKDLRNPVVHAREQRTVLVIAPTTANYERMRPWAELANAAAEQVVAFRKN